MLVVSAPPGEVHSGQELCLRYLYVASNGTVLDTSELQGMCVELNETVISRTRYVGSLGSEVFLGSSPKTVVNIYILYSLRKKPR